MKTSTLITMLIFFLIACSRQTIKSFHDGQENARRYIFPPEIVTLKDSILNYTFVLDSSHLYVTTYDSIGNTIWKSDPFKDNKSENQRNNRPIIVHCYFGESHDGDPVKRHKVLWIYYHNEAGYLDLKTGKYRWDKVW